MEFNLDTQAEPYKFSHLHVGSRRQTGGRHKLIPWGVMRKRMKQLSIAAFLILSAACDADPTAPSRFATVSSIRYQRERPFDPAITSPLFLQFSYPVAGDPYGRYHQTSCVLERRGDEGFACTSPLSWQVPADAECNIQVLDPAVTTNTFHMVATAVFVNGQRLRRVQVFANGVEIARFRVTSRGEIQ
jgi:hypothetical protein